MEHQDSEEEKMEASHNSNDDLQEYASVQKGGLRTIPFILATPVSQMIITSGISANMILYLINGYHLDISTGSIILSSWSALSDYLVILAALVSDSYFGRFRVIAMGSIFSVLGLALLWLTAVLPQAKPAPCYPSSNIKCQTPTFTQLALLLLSLGFISVGSGSIRPCSMALGADQLVKKENLESNVEIVNRYFNWYYACISLSPVIGYTIIVYIQDHFGMNVGFGIPAILMFLSASFFLGGLSLYVKVKPQKSLLSELAQVLIVAYKNRKLVLSPDYLDLLYHHREDSEFVTPSDRLRFLNKACLVRGPQEDFNYDGSAAKRWKLCTVDQVEALKSLIKIIPMWSTGIMIYTTVLQTSTVLQAKIMDRHVTSNFQIPAGSFSIFTALSVTLWIFFYAQVIVPLMAKYTGHSEGLSSTVRMGIGLILSCFSMGLAAVVENIRRRTAIQEGLLDVPNGVVSMSALWLIPHCCLSGIAEGFSFVGQTEYYFAHLPKNMSTISMALFTLGTAVAGTLGSIIITIVNSVTMSGGKDGWFSNNLNKGHYDYYYGLLAFLSLLNFVYFLICCDAYGPKRNAKASVSNETEDLEETLLFRTSPV